MIKDILGKFHNIKGNLENFTENLTPKDLWQTWKGTSWIIFIEFTKKLTTNISCRTIQNKFLPILQKNRALQDNEGQILKVRTMQENAGLYKPCICKLCLDTRMLFGPCKVRKQWDHRIINIIFLELVWMFKIPEWILPVKLYFLEM